MTQEEIDAIVAAVIASLRTNGKTIMQLTEVTSVSDNDYFELHGGRRVAYSYLYEELLAETQNIIDVYQADMGGRIDDLEDDLQVGLAEKMDFHDASWLDNDSVGNLYFDKLVSAINNSELIIVNGTPIVYTQVLDSGNTVRAFSLKGKVLTRYTAVKGSAIATITRTTYPLLDQSDKTNIEADITTLQDAIVNLQSSDSEQNTTLAAHETAIETLGTIKINSSDVYTKSQVNTLLGGKVSISGMHLVAGQSVLNGNVFTHYVEHVTMNNNVVTGDLSWYEIAQLEEWGVTVCISFRDEIYQQSYSDSSEKMWTCGKKRLRLTNGNVWTYEPMYYTMPSANVIFEGINDEYIIVGESTVSTCLNELYHVTEMHNVQLAGLNEVYCTLEQYQLWVDEGTIDPDTKYYIYEE